MTLYLEFAGKSRDVIGDIMSHQISTDWVIFSMPFFGCHQGSILDGLVDAPDKLATFTPLDLNHSMPILHCQQGLSTPPAFPQISGSSDQAVGWGALHKSSSSWPFALTSCAQARTSSVRLI